MIELKDSVSKIKGIGSKKKERLQVLGIHTVSDLLMHLPVRYRNRSEVTLSFYLKENIDQLASGRLVRKNVRTISGRRTMLTCTFADESGSFQAMFFNMPFLAKSLEQGKIYSVFGKCRRQRGAIVFMSPEICLTGSDRDERGILPVYRCTAGITSTELSKWVRFALENTDGLSEEWLPNEVVQRRKLCSSEYMMTNLHFPSDHIGYKVARSRYIYEQLYLYLLIIRWNREQFAQDSGEASVSEIDISPFLQSLPFEMTEGQQQAVSDIFADLTNSRPMNRLVQGDVGCGKTVVAEAAIFRVAKAGAQSVFMAPTEILARQHYAKLSHDLEPLQIKCALLISAMKAAEKRRTLERIRSGAVDVVIGTHAVLQDNVKFHNLRLVVTDEQHRFGVNQRKTLVQKSTAANVLVMSATPIPRTMAATVFGDMDFTIIRTRPKSRKPIITRSADATGRNKAYANVLEELNKGHRAYVVAPSIEAGETDEMVSVEKLYSDLSKRLGGHSIAMLHGQMSSDDKNRIMRAFAEGAIEVLVSTVVIEVGIDVPEATIIVIENSDRFGLAQLHQLRGRVGRSNRQSYCWLINYSRSEIAKERIQVMISTNDGFEISEEDYRLRGPGDLMGTMQHGSGSAVWDLFRYTEILEVAQEDVNDGTAYELPEVRRRMDSFFTEDNSEIL